MKLVNAVSARSDFALLALVGSLSMSGCNSHSLQAPNPLPETQTEVSQDVNPIRDVDIVFMVDDSGSMKEEQDNLAKNFTAFMTALKNIPGGLPNVHIGVISSDVGAGGTQITGNNACNRPGGDRGIFQTKASCGLQQDARFLISLNNGTQNNFTGNIETVFGCIASLGTLGCGYEHQLQSVRVALAENVTPQNAGFLRPTAFLAVILITDEDDCSAPPDSDLFVDSQFATGMAASLRCNMVGHMCNNMPLPRDVFSTPLYNTNVTPPVANCTDWTAANPRLIPVKEFSNFLFSLKPGAPDKIIVSAITGWPAKLDTPYTLVKNPTGDLDIGEACVSANGSAAPAIRINKFIEQFGDNGSVESICQADFSPALKRIADRIAAKLDPGCIPNKLVDTDLVKAGLQEDCSVVERVPNETTGIPDDKIIGAKCDNLADPANSTNKPCYALIQDAKCTSPQGGTWRGQVFRTGDAAPGTLQIIRCRTCLKDDPKRCM